MSAKRIFILIGATVLGCIGLIACFAIGQATGIIPRGYETKTAEAREAAAARSTDEFIQGMTATIIALTPSATPTNTSTPTRTPLPSDTPPPSATPTVTSTPSPADRAAQVVRNLRDTDISDNDFRESTSIFEDRAVVKIFISQSTLSESAAIEQVRKDYPRLACDLRKAGFTTVISITGLANFIDGQGNTSEMKAIEVTLNEPTIAALDCDNVSDVDIFAIADSLYIHPSIDFESTTASGSSPPTARPTRRPTAQPSNNDSFVVNPASGTRYIAGGGSVNIRSGPGTTYNILGSLPTGTEITITGESNDWYQIEYASGNGWVSAQLTSTSQPSVSNPENPPGATQFTCPSNCDGAVQMGLSPQQAAACGLDRDDDGMACYGD